jgi:peptide/nickel transport system ATP-binding protein
MSAQPPLLDVRGVSKQFGSSGWLRRLANLAHRHTCRARIVHAVDEVSIEVRAGEALGIVGESGCGKSTLGRVAAGLMKPDQGAVLIDGDEFGQLRGAERKRARQRIQMIFQSSTSSLNPRRKVGQILEEPLKVYGSSPANERLAQVLELLAKVGLPRQMLDRYPNQLSGGQSQRVGIARALTVNPDLIICDEPVSALDVSVQAQILNLFQDLRQSLGLSYLFISHDLSVVERVSDRVAVMYLGKVVEEAPTAKLFASPQHPYTIALLRAAPVLGGTRVAAEPTRGERPSPYAKPSGCSFHPRCPFAMDICRKITPARTEISDGHFSACHLHGKASSTAVDGCAA